MQQLAPIQKQTTPFLISHAVQRTEGEALRGYYSCVLSMWVTDESGTEIPAINSSNASIEMATKTRNNQESDDHYSFCSVQELSTKTSTHTEKDDTRGPVILELATKTDAQMESDDTSPYLNDLFL